MKSFLVFLFCLVIYGCNASNSTEKEKTKQKDTLQNTGNENNHSGCAMCLPK